MTHLRTPYVLTAALAASLVMAAPKGGGGLAPAQRNAGGYTWSSFAVLDAAPGAKVTAVADHADGLLVGHAPMNSIDRLDAKGVATNEAMLNYPPTSFTSAGDYAAVGEPGVAGAADIFMRNNGAWDLSLDGAGSQMLVARNGSFLYGIEGDPGQDGTLHVLGKAGWASAATLAGAMPTAAFSDGRKLYIGAGPSGETGPARLFSARRTRVSEVRFTDPGPALAATERQQVEAVASAGGLIVALGTYDAATGTPLRGQLLQVGRRGATTQLATFAGEVPTALAALEGSVYVGTSNGRLLYLGTDGAWTDEPGLPPNLGIHSLQLSSAGALLAGMETTAGAELLARATKAPAPPPPPVAPLAPSNLTAAAPVAGRVDLSWTDNSNDEAEFLIERSAAGANAYLQIAKVKANTTAYADTTVLAATTYDYRVLSNNAGGKSAPSNVATVTTLAAGKTYLADVKPILMATNCAGCHVAVSKYRLSAGLVNDTSDYQNTLMFSDLANPTNSKLLLKASGNGHPVKLILVGSPQYNTIVEWMQGGGAFN